ncbi:MAG: hypothetical protein PHI35_00510 [Victivallaceae bacterium]|nr:hypothetical protein [Victivallaceae bacterium]
MTIATKTNLSCALLAIIACGAVSLTILVGSEEMGRLASAVLHDHERPSLEDALPLISTAALLVVCIIALTFMGYLKRRTVLPMERAAAFAGRLAGGEDPAPLPATRDGETAELYASLNLVRDRELSLNNKLKLSLTREAEIRREIEHYDGLQLRIIERLLPEMRIALNAVKGYGLIALNALEDNHDPESLMPVVGRQLRCAAALARQIERVIDLCSLGRERWSAPEMETFDTAMFMRELIEMNSISMKARELTLINRFSSSAPVALVFDRRLLFQLLTLLIRSVGRASGAGETVTFGCFSEKGEVVFDIRDTATVPAREALAGMYECAPHDLDTVAMIDAISVNVMGLVFIRQIVEKMGCKLKVFAAEGAHAVVQVRIDITSCAAEEESRLIVPTPLAPRWTAESVAPPSKSRLKALLGDRIEEDREILPLLLGREGIDVTVAVDEDDLMRKLAAGEYDVLLVSLGVENRAPDDALANLRARSKRRELPVVVMLRVFGEAAFQRLQELSGVACVTYPLNYELLARLLRQMGGMGGFQK